MIKIGQRSLSNVARNIGHGLIHVNDKEISEARRELALALQKTDDDYEIGYLHAMLEILAAYQREKNEV